jgi:hypothetical protein
VRNEKSTPASTQLVATKVQSTSFAARRSFTRATVWERLWCQRGRNGNAETARTFERGIEQGKKLKRKIIAGGQLMIVRSRRSGADQTGREVPLKLLKQFPVVKLIFTERRLGVSQQR